MNPEIAWRIFKDFAILFVLFFIGCLAISSTFPAKSTFSDSAATLTFITASAVAIERSIEGFWTVLGGIKGSYWPLSSITKQVDALVEELDISLKPFHEKAQVYFQQLKDEGKIARQDADSAVAEVQRLKARFDELKTLSPDNQRVQLLTASASQNVNYLSEKYGDLIQEFEQAKNIANTSINGLQDFLSSFKDNPGRRMISLFIGAIAGMVFSTFFQLDLFQAVLSGPFRFPALSVVVTGLIIGLGSNPTHEVIRALQEYKKAKKGANVAAPNLPSQ